MEWTPVWTVVIRVWCGQCGVCAVTCLCLPFKIRQRINKKKILTKKRIRSRRFAHASSSSLFALSMCEVWTRRFMTRVGLVACTRIYLVVAITWTVRKGNRVLRSNLMRSAWDFGKKSRIKSDWWRVQQLKRLQ